MVMEDPPIKFRWIYLTVNLVGEFSLLNFSCLQKVCITLYWVTVVVGNRKDDFNPSVGGERGVVKWKELSRKQLFQSNFKAKLMWVVRLH